MPTKNGPKIVFSIGETGVSWSENCIFCRGWGGGGLLVVGSKVAFFHIMRLLLIYWCSLCIIIATNIIVFLTYSIVFCFENDILQPFSIGPTNPVHTAL